MPTCGLSSFLELRSFLSQAQARFSVALALAPSIRDSSRLENEEHRLSFPIFVQFLADKAATN